MTGTLKAKVNGSWVPIMGSGQEAANLARWNSAWGVVGEARAVTDYPAINNATATVSDMSVTVTTVAGRVYKISGTIGAGVIGRAAVANSRDLMYLQRDGSTIARIMDETIGPASTNQSFSLDWSVTDRPSAGSHTYSIQVATAVNDSVSLNGSAVAPRINCVQDIGPTAPAAIAPPTAAPYTIASGNALGIVAVGSFNGTGSLPLNVLTQITNSLSVTMAVGRRYRVAFRMRAATVTSAGAPSSIAGFLRDGTTEIPDVNGPWWTVNSVVGQYNSLAYDWVFDGDGTTKSLNVALRAGNAAASIYPNVQCYYYVEDVGPNQFPALPIPATPPAWTPIPLTNFTVVGGAVPSYRKIGDVVSLRGNLTGGTNGGVGATLPVGFRPPASCELAVFAYNGGWTYCNLTIGNNGDIYWINPPGVSAVPNNVSLWNIQYSTTP